MSNKVNGIKLPIPNYSQMSVFQSFSGTQEKTYTITNDGFYDIYIRNGTEAKYYHITDLWLNSKKLFSQSMAETAYFESYIAPIYLRKNDVLKIKVRSNGNIPTEIRYIPLL